MKVSFFFSLKYIKGSTHYLDDKQDIDVSTEAIRLEL